MCGAQVCFTLAPEEIWAILLHHPLGYFGFHSSPWLSAQAQPIFSTGDIMERCSSNTTSANPWVKKTSLHSHKHPWLFTDKDNFWLCPKQFAAGPVAQPWMDAGWWCWRWGTELPPKCGVCQSLSPAGTHSLTALGPQCLPAREAETGQLHPGLLFSLSFCLLFGELVALLISLNALAPSQLVCLLKLLQDSYGRWCFLANRCVCKEQDTPTTVSKGVSGSSYSLFSRERLLSEGAWSTCHYWSRHRTLLHLPQPSRKNELVNEALAMGPQ